LFNSLGLEVVKLLDNFFFLDCKFTSGIYNGYIVSMWWGLKQRRITFTPKEQLSLPKTAWYNPANNVCVNHFT
jgi:hypothetical protein